MIRNLSVNGYVGFDSCTEQLVEKAVARGFTFNILCIGETGIGKSTMMDSLFNTSFEHEAVLSHQDHVSLQSRTYELKEAEVNLKLTIVDTVGFGDQVNKSDSWKPIVEYIDAQFEAFMQEEMKIKRDLTGYHDARIHCCLYFIPPTGHSLRAIDVLVMSKLDKKVNIIPIISKSDTLSKKDLAVFKSQIIKELHKSEINIYQFPVDDEEMAFTNAEMNNQLPFALVGSVEFTKIGGKEARCRQYPWGIVEIENEEHCDFVKLREMLIRTNMDDMIEKTDSIHYRHFRKYRLQQMGFTDESDSSNTQSQPSHLLNIQQIYEHKKKEIMNEMRIKEEEMRSDFVARVKKKEAELFEKEKELKNKHESLKKLQEDRKSKIESEIFTLQQEQDVFNKKKQSISAATLKKKKSFL